MLSRRPASADPLVLSELIRIMAALGGTSGVRCLVAVGLPVPIVSIGMLGLVVVLALTSCVVLRVAPLSPASIMVVVVLVPWVSIRQCLTWCGP